MMAKAILLRDAAHTAWRVTWDESVGEAAPALSHYCQTARRRHPCIGMRFAKLEMKIICALFLTSYQYTHVDANGNRAVVKASDVDRNDVFQARPKGVPPTLKYQRVL